MRAVLTNAIEKEDGPSPADIRLRDEFAMAALTGFLANPNLTSAGDLQSAESAYIWADAMMKAREPDPLGRDASGVTPGMRDYLAKGREGVRS